MNRRTSTPVTANSRRSSASRRWESCAEPCPGARSRWCWSGPPSIATSSWKTGAFAARIRRQNRFDRWSNADDSLESDEIESPSRTQAAGDFCRRVVRYRGPVEGQVRRNPRTPGRRTLLRAGAPRGRRGHLAQRRRDRPRRDVRRSPRQAARLCLRSCAPHTIFAKPKHPSPNPCIVRAKVSVTRYPVSVTASSRFFPKFPEFPKQFLCLNRCEGKAFPGRFQERFTKGRAQLFHILLLINIRRVTSKRHSRISGYRPSCSAQSPSRVTPNPPPSRRKPFP